MTARLLALAVWAHILVIAASRGPCLNWNRRSLLQTGDAQTGDAPRPESSPSERVPGSNSTITAVEVDLLQLECVISFNSYFDRRAGRNIQLVTGQDNNFQPSAEDCCIQCHQHGRCNAWIWCPLEEGCSVVAQDAAIPGDEMLVSPYRGCKLLQIRAFSPYDSNFGAEFRVHGPDIDFISGVPINISVPSLPEYDVLMGVDLGGDFDYVCDAMGTSPCLLNAPATDVASICQNDPDCQAFVFFPEGLMMDGSGPVGILKSNGNSQIPISRVDTEVDPGAATYIKRPALAASDDSSSNTESTVVIIVVSALGGVLLVAGIVGAVLYARRYRQLARSFPVSDVSTASAGRVEIAVSEVRAKDDDKDANLYGVDLSPARTSGSSDSGVDGSDPSTETNGPDDALRLGEIASGASTAAVVPATSVIEIEALRAGAAPPASLLQLASSSLPAAPPSSNAKELLLAFSAAYRQRPQPDYAALMGMLQREEVEEEEKSEGHAGSSHSDTPPSSEYETMGGIGRARDPHLSLSAGIKIQPEDVEICRHVDGSFWELGTGAFGRVYKGRYRGSRIVAVKVLHRLEEPRASEAFVREVALLRSLRHRNVVRFLGACLDGPQGTALLVTELMELGDLWRALPARNSTGNRIFGWYQRGRGIIEDVARGLAYLHAQRLVHFDLKSANILLTSRGDAKLADIGMARVLCKSYFSVISGLGTFAWSAPEVLAGKRCSEKADIYSLGVVLWEICTGEPPTRGHMRPLQAPEDCPTEVVALHARCLSEHPEDRPSAQEILGILSVLPGI